MDNVVVAFDEAGNTGQNLLDAVQPVFVLASVHMNDDEIRAIRRALEMADGEEVHFVKLRKSRDGQRRIHQALNSGILSPANTKTCVYHKRFMIVAKAVDMLAEPVACRMGVNLYEKALNLAMTNFIYATAPCFCSEDVWNQFLTSFVEMIRDKSDERIKAFYDIVHALMENCRDEGFKDVLLPFACSEQIIEEIMESVDVTDLDPAIPSFITLAIRWGEQVGGQFDIIHDTSKPIAHQQKIIESLMSLDGPSVVVGYGNRTGTYPIRSTGISFGESDSDLQIQVADLVSSATLCITSGLCDPARQDRFWQESHATPWLDWVTDVVWPTRDVTPEALGAARTDCIDPVEYCVELMRQHGLKKSGEC